MKRELFEYYASIKAPALKRRKRLAPILSSVACAIVLFGTIFGFGLTTVGVSVRNGTTSLYGEGTTVLFTVRSLGKVEISVSEGELIQGTKGRSIQTNGGEIVWISPTDEGILTVTKFGKEIVYDLVFDGMWKLVKRS